MTILRTGSIVPITPPGPRLRFHIDPEVAARQGGAGGWTAIDRPRKVQAALWTGLPAYTLDLDLIFGTENTDPVEDDCLYLQRLGRPAKDGLEPPILQIAYHNYSAMRWVITDIGWSNETREKGLRTQATAAVKFLEHHPLTTVAKTVATKAKDLLAGGIGGGVGAAAQNPTTSRSRTYTVRSGDTLASVAQRMGVSQAAIAKANGLWDGRPTVVALPPGLVLQIPAK
jgi:LysM repeat protein